MAVGSVPFIVRVRQLDILVLNLTRQEDVDFGVLAATIVSMARAL